MHDTRFSFIEWAAKTGNKTECIVCICNIYIYIHTVLYILYIIYIYIYIYKHFSKKISQNVENDCF